MNNIKAVISLGSNINNPILNIQKALISIDNIIDTKIIKTSSFYITSPLEYEEQPDFINAIVIINTKLDKFLLLDNLQAIEKDLGRIRNIKNGPRNIDIDIIDYNHEQIDSKLLILPHPRAYQRAFVLKPLKEIDENFQLNNHSINYYLDKISNQKITKIINLY